MSSPNFALSNDEKIALLEELHRPLEEHWSVKTKFGLDAKSSEYIYKHHITRLEDIYTNHKTTYPETPGLLYMSPVSQLYGVNGLNLDHDEGKLKKKEQKWVSNFQKHAALTDAEQSNRPSTAGASTSRSPNRLRQSYSGPASRGEDVFDRKRKGAAEPASSGTRNTRSKCTDRDISGVDLIVMGLYRLDDAQEEIYQKFVDMLAGFDEFDKANILQDAMQDAQGEEDLLGSYGGTTLPAPHTHTHGGRPHTAGSRPTPDQNAATAHGHSRNQ